MLLAVPKWLSVAVAAVTVLAFTPAAVLAVGDDPPKPSSNQPKPKSKSKPKPKSKDKNKDSRLNQDEIYSLGYWQAKRGEYAEALATLRSAPNAADPRVEAMVYYNRVLAKHPERTTTRQYLGEAFLQIGAPERAKEQLAEIAKRCGVACEDYQLLAVEIAKYEQAG
jgi:tetratricopeptide (TPR) repeat protein